MFKSLKLIKASINLVLLSLEGLSSLLLIKFEQSLKLLIVLNYSYLQKVTTVIQLSHFTFQKENWTRTSDTKQNFSTAYIIQPKLLVQTFLIPIYLIKRSRTTTKKLSQCTRNCHEKVHLNRKRVKARPVDADDVTIQSSLGNQDGEHTRNIKRYCTPDEYSASIGMAMYRGNIFRMNSKNI